MHSSLKDIYQEIYHMDLKITFRKKPYQWHTFRHALIGSVVYFFKIFKDFFLFGREMATNPDDLKAKIWLIIGTKNNLDTLSFLHENLENSIYIATNKKVQELAHCSRLNFHPAAFHWFKGFYLLFSLWPVFGKALLLRFDIFMKGIGLYETGKVILRRYQPQAIIFTNDHSPQERALLWAAKKLNIPNVYIQHASITADFPPLRYNLSLLEGMDSLEKYKACGPVEGKVALVGMPKFDPYFLYKNTRKDIQHIGLCTNIWDDENRIEHLLIQLHNHYPDIKLTFRPHPGEVRSFHLPEGVFSSDSKKENIFDFLVKQDLVIAGDTSLHLEAALLNINSLYYPLNDFVSDVYGYVQKGLVEKIDNLESLTDWIMEKRNNRPDVPPQVKYYNALVGTSEEGNSQALVLLHIRELLTE